MGTYIITRALKYNMPKRLVLHMMVNQAIDSAIGIIPFIGDIFDFGFKVGRVDMCIEWALCCCTCVCVALSCCGQARMLSAANNAYVLSTAKQCTSCLNHKRSWAACRA